MNVKDSHRPEAARKSHDRSLPAALIEFMTQGWASSSLSAVPIDGIGNFRRRRSHLSRRFDGELLVVATGSEKVRANDQMFNFRPGSDFYYLTGHQGPDAVLLMIPQNGSHKAVLYLDPSYARSDPRFYTDRSKGELWVGSRLDLAQAEKRYGLLAKNRATLLDDLDAARRDVSGVRIIRGFDAQLEARLGTEMATDSEFAAFVSNMRIIKDEYEIGRIEQAIAITKRGFEDVLRSLPAAKTERELEGVFNMRARVEGNDVGYWPIVASGANACTLHWMRNTGDLRSGDLLLLDAGVETCELYTADITRTFPINGRFSPEQRAIYELVFSAQKVALHECRPGNHFMAPYEAAMKVIAHGLERLGILSVPAEEALDDDKQFFKRYSLHTISHMLGIDVHDCAQARKEAYMDGVLQSGMVLTIEPGLYFQPDDVTVPERYRGIGVRIEDDVLITTDGHRILSAALPRQIDDVEYWMAEVANAPRA